MLRLQEMRFIRDLYLQWRVILSLMMNMINYLRQLER
nr:MAG TPA: hypothetical protein [Bacteriophage sp.]